MNVTATIWAILPPIIAIVLALITKEVYSSLMVGIIAGALLYTGFQPITAVQTLFEIMGEKVGGNINICMFLVLLGILVSLITKSGASRAYGEWAVKSIKSRRGASFATLFLGCFIFVDDYFNCLTVGTVMRPVTDKYSISRAKLAYIIDATAAPVCIIAPISSWAAAVGSSLPEGSSIDGFSLFLQTIPFNIYALLTLAFLAFMIIADFDFGPMKKYQQMHKNDDLSHIEETHVVAGSGKVLDLIIPISILIVLCVCGMLYTGGILEGASVVEAFANCDSSISLVMGSFLTLIITFIMYIPRKILSFGQFCESFTEGFKAMVPAILILTLAWTLSGICSPEYLNIGGYVKMLVSSGAMITMFMPAIFFLIALGLAFATGTSWGTFGILIPISVVVFGDSISTMLVLTVAACLAGAVAGDHISPISDTTILASAGAQCNHIEHVSTQLPYSLLITVVSFVGFLVGGITENGALGISVSAVVLIAIMIFLFVQNKRKTT